MLALIKREISDHWLIFALGAIVAGLFAFVIIWHIMFLESAIPPLGILAEIPIPYALILFLLSAVLGATQMFSDLSQKKSSFLVTLATTRQRILSAKIFAGLLWILMFLSPIIIFEILMLTVFPRLAPPEITFPLEILTTCFLASLCCYMLGLQMGWQTNRRSAVLGSIILAPLLLSVIIIKGFCVQTIIILALLAITMFIRTWQKFMSTSL